MPHANALKQASWTETGSFYQLNYDRMVVDEECPLFAVIDSECDDGAAGNIVQQALLRGCRELHAARRIDRSHAAVALERILLDAHRDIQIAAKNSRRAGGASVTALTYSEGFLVGAHVGECRAYVLLDDAWMQLTREHTLGAYYDENPDLQRHTAPEQAERIILNALGVADSVRIDSISLALPSPANVLLCSPGAWGPLDKSPDAYPLPSNATSGQLVDYIQSFYAKAGKTDNATVVVGAIRS